MDWISLSPDMERISLSPDMDWISLYLDMDRISLSPDMDDCWSVVNKVIKLGFL